MNKNNRGVVDPATWAVIGLIALGSVLYAKVFEPGRNKKVADQIATATAQANKEAEQAKLLAIELQKAINAAQEAHDKVSKTEEKMRMNAHSFNGQGKALLVADPNPSPYNMIARGMCDSVDDALGLRSTPEQQAAWAARVVPLLQRNAEVEKQLADERAKSTALAASLASEHAHALASDAHAATLASENSANVTTIINTTAKAEKLAAENKKWADGAVSWADRFKAALLGIAVLAILIFVLSWKIRGSTKTLHDTAALAEDVQAAAARGVVMTKEQIEEWWQGDHSGKAAYEKIKANLRR